MGGAVPRWRAGDKVTPTLAETRAAIWAKRWVDLNNGDFGEGTGVNILDRMRAAGHDPNFDTNKCKRCGMDAAWDDNGKPRCKGRS
jgi:hypothetical protein